MLNTLGSGGASLVGGIGNEMQNAFHRFGSGGAQGSNKDPRFMSSQELYLMISRHPELLSAHPEWQRLFPEYCKLYGLTHDGANPDLTKH